MQEISNPPIIFLFGKHLDKRNLWQLGRADSSPASVYSARVQSAIRKSLA